MSGSCATASLPNCARSSSSGVMVRLAEKKHQGVCPPALPHCFLLTTYSMSENSPVKVAPAWMSPPITVPAVGVSTAALASS